MLEIHHSGWEPSKCDRDLADHLTQNRHQVQHGHTPTVLSRARLSSQACKQLQRPRSASISSSSCSWAVACSSEVGTRCMATTVPASSGDLVALTTTGGRLARAVSLTAGSGTTQRAGDDKKQQWVSMRVKVRTSVGVKVRTKF